MENFTLQHVVLYSKHWYKRTDIWNDLRKCLTADGYCGEVFTNNDCVSIILNQLERLLEYMQT
jgi:hypothetical protein